MKPVVVLVLFGTILYGAYSVVQKGPTSADAPQTAASSSPAAASEAPAFTAPDVQLAAAPPAAPPAAVQPPVSAAALQPLPAAPAAAAAEAPAAAAAAGAAAAVAAAAVTAPTYLDAQSAPPPSTHGLEPTTDGRGDDRFATIATATPTALPRPTPVPPPTPASGSSAAFATAWADAHDKLTAGRYAEALAALSVWYDDPSLGLEESQKLEDLLGQLAGTVVYSQEDLLLPPHVVAAGETLSTIAAPLGISPRLLAKINGVSDPQQLVPGEHLKLVRGPFDAVVSISRRRISLQLNGSYAGSFPVVVGRQFLGRVGGAIPVAETRPGAETAAGPTKPAIILGEGLILEAAEDPGVAAETAADTSLVVSVRDLYELLDILGPGSRILVRQ